MKRNLRQTAGRLLLGTAMGLVVSGAGMAPAVAEDWVSPCTLATDYATQGPAFSDYAEFYDDICATAGDAPQPRSCLTWGEAFATLGDKVWSQAELEELVAQCEAALGAGPVMTGDTACGGEGEPECKPPDDQPVLLDQGVPPVIDPVVDPVAAPVADPVIDPVIGPDDGPVMGVDTGGCGPNMECLPPDPPEEVLEVAPVPNAGQEPAQDLTQDPALDLAFWNSIKDSDNPMLFQAYLDQFPQGTFGVIARERLKALGGQGALMVPAPTPAPTLAQSPEQIHNRAMVLMSQAFSAPLAQWDAMLQKPKALLEANLANGFAASFVALGELYENGNGVRQNPDEALKLYLEGARLGALEGYWRGLMLMDQFGNESGYVPAFLELYAQDSGMALDSLHDVSSTASVWLQRHLQGAGYYNGALDGDFGTGSRQALRAFVSGAPKPAPVASTPQPVTDNLAVLVQTELARVGCYLGVIDGKWGPGSVQALRNYNHWHGEIADTDRPTDYALEVLRATPGQVCGLD